MDKKELKKTLKKIDGFKWIKERLLKMNDEKMLREQIDIFYPKISK